MQHDFRKADNLAALQPPHTPTPYDSTVWCHILKILFENDFVPQKSRVGKGRWPFYRFVQDVHIDVLGSVVCTSFLGRRSPALSRLWTKTSSRFWLPNLATVKCTRYREVWITSVQFLRKVNTFRTDCTRTQWVFLQRRAMWPDEHTKYCASCVHRVYVITIWASEDAVSVLILHFLINVEVEESHVRQGCSLVRASTRWKLIS